MYSVGTMDRGCLSTTVIKPATERRTSPTSNASINTYPGMEDRAKAVVIAGGWISLGSRHRRQIWNTTSASRPTCPSFVSGARLRAMHNTDLHPNRPYTGVGLARHAKWQGQIISCCRYGSCVVPSSCHDSPRFILEILCSRAFGDSRANI